MTPTPDEAAAVERLRDAPRTELFNVDGDRLIGPRKVAVTVQDRDAVLSLIDRLTNPAPDPRSYEDRAVVFVTVCVDQENKEAIHLFSSAEKRKEWAETDQRFHIFYDYVLDEPDLHEKLALQQ